MSKLFPGKKSKKPSKLPTNLLLGITTNVAVGPLGFRAVVDVDPKDKDNPEPSRIVSLERESDPQEPPVPGNSTAAAIHDIEEVDRPTRGTFGHIGWEDELAMEPGGPEQDHKATIRPGIKKETVSGFGPLKSVLEAISAVYAGREESVAINNKVKLLLLRVTSLDAFFASLPGGVPEQRRRDEVIRELKDIEDQLRPLSEGLELQWLTDHATQDEDILTLLENLREVIFHYQIVRRTRIGDQAFKSIDPAESAILNNIRYAQKAEYRHGNRDRCLKGTRIAILDKIELWTYDFHKPPVYWLNGLAGTGKSTIARTIAERTFADGPLGASFFCSRDFEDLRNLEIIFPTIAVQLARRYPEFRTIFIPLVQSDPDIIYESLYGQMDKLIVQPLVKCAISTVIIIDALDECEDDEPASAILSVLGQFVDQIPRVKFFVTGRPEPRIRYGFQLPLLAKATDVFILHEVELAQVKNDIRLFYKHSCSEIMSNRHLLDDWPTEEQLDLLCERAAGLFIYAMATVKFIDQKSKDPKDQLDRLIQSQDSGSEGKAKLKANATLDSLYMSILHEAFGDDDPEDDPKVRSVLGAVVLAANPLSPSTIAVLLGFSARSVFPLLSSVHSLLILSEEIDQPVRPFHKSFPDFIVDPARCTDPRFCIYPPDQHMGLLVGCLKLMNLKLMQNMCKLPDGVTNAEVKDLKQRAEQYIDQPLEYACRSWHKHIKDMRSSQKLKITPILHQFLEEKFLFWLEVLSILGSVREAVDALERADKWLNVSRTLDLTRDYFRFTLAFFDVIRTSAPHIYISALPLSPQTSIVRELYKQYIFPLARVVQGLPVSWNPVLVTIYHEDSGMVAAWSPCNRFVAIAGKANPVTRSTMIEILDAATLEQLNTFESPQGTKNQQLGFSPDSRTLIQFDQEKLTSWDLQTGVPLGTVFSERLKLVGRSSFSFTCSMDGKLLAVANASSLDRNSIDTYDVFSRTYICSYHAPEGRIVVPIWTHGEKLRFVTVKPGSIIVWEVAFNLVHTPAMIRSLPTPDEIADIKDEEFIFLPALSQLAFSAQDTIFIWDAHSSRFLLKFKPNPTSYFHRASFSSDGQFFSHTTGSQEIYVWKRSPISYDLHQVFPLTSTRPLLSPNGKSIVITSGSTMHLWHTRDKTLSLPNVQDHENEGDFILGFSPNEALAAFSCFMGNKVSILDLQSGDLQVVIDVGMEVMCLGVTGSAVAVAGGGKVITWNLPVENCINAMASVNDSVCTTMLACSDLASSTERSISPDLKCIAIVERGNPFNLQVHTTSTGRQLVGINVLDGLKWVTLGEHEVWCIDYKNSVEGWKVIQDSESGITKLESLETTMCIPQVFPWQSHYGYKVTRDGWVLSPTKKRLLWLPHHWRTWEELMMWSGHFFGLRQRRLPEVVIIEFFE